MYIENKRANAKLWFQAPTGDSGMYPQGGLLEADVL